MSSSSPPVAEHSVRVSATRTPAVAWCFEVNDGFSFEVENRDFAELADPAELANLRYTADLFMPDGQLVRRVALEPFPATVGIGDTATFDVPVGLAALAGDYEIRFGIEHTDGRTIRVTSESCAVKAKLTIFELFMELISVCNFACTFCPQPDLQRKGQLMDFELAKKILHDLADMGHHHPIRLHLLGEPLLYPRFFDIVEEAHRVGQRINLATNGSKFDPEIIDGIFRVGLDELVISQNTPEREFYDEQRGAKMSYEAYNESLYRMVRAIVQRDNPPQTIIQVLYKQENRLDPKEVERINGIIEHWAEVVRDASGDNQLTVDPIPAIDPCGPTVVDLYPSLQLSFSSYHDWGEGGSPEGHFCSFPMRQFVVLVDGQASICCVDAEGEINLGDVNTQSIQSIWEGPKLQAIRDAFWNESKAIESRCQRCPIDHREMAAPFR